MNPKANSFDRGFAIDRDLQAFGALKGEFISFVVDDSKARIRAKHEFDCVDLEGHDCV